MKYEMYAVSTVCVYLDEIEADSLEDAYEKAEKILEDKNTSFCHHCSTDMESDENWEIKEITS